ncbi:MAG: TRAP transporter small permease subunit [Cohaesibacteraceae bacterium]|nr:TRAP transporter small permease subunit [Cohaesibacteraceae bacterium]
MPLPAQLILNGLETVNNRVGKTIRWFALIMVLLQFGIVLLRYLFGISFVFLGEGVLYMHAALFMLGAGYTMVVDGHVRVDIFYAGFSQNKKAAVNLFGHIVFLLPMCAMIAWTSWRSVVNSWSILEGPISVGGIPASFLLKSLIPAFCVLLFIQALVAIGRDASVLFGCNKNSAESIE